MNPSEQVCPQCNHKNEAAAAVCVNCGTDLTEGVPTRSVLQTVNVEKKGISLTDYMGSAIDLTAIPEGGLGIRVAGELKPMYLTMEQELLLGRRTETSPEALLDLTILNAVNLGVSRRHALIKRSATGFEVTDLASRNGTWLNNERLTPNKPYPFDSGSLLRLGHLQLLIMYHSARKKSTTSGTADEIPS